MAKRKLVTRLAPQMTLDCIAFAGDELNICRAWDTDQICFNILLLFKLNSFLVSCRKVMFMLFHFLFPLFLYSTGKPDTHRREEETFSNTCLIPSSFMCVICTAPKGISEWVFTRWAFFLSWSWWDGLFDWNSSWASSRESEREREATGC